MDAGAGTDVHEEVGGEHHVAVVFDDDDAVAEVAELLEALDEALVVALVEADGGFVEDVEHVDQLRAYLRGQSYALGFAAGERGGAAVHGEVAHADVGEEVQALEDFAQHLVGHGGVAGVQLGFEVGEPLLQLQQVHVGQLADVLVEDAEG